jgi:hypothetical protein
MFSEVNFMIALFYLVHKIEFYTIFIGERCAAEC